MSTFWTVLATILAYEAVLLALRALVRRRAAAAERERREWERKRRVRKWLEEPCIIPFPRRTGTTDAELN